MSQQDRMVLIVKQDEEGFARFDNVAEFTNVTEALKSIATGKHGEGPFDIHTVNRQGVCIKKVEKFQLDEGKSFGGRGSSKVKDEEVKPKSSSRDGKGKFASGATA